MFKVVDPAISDSIAAIPGIAVVDVQLVDDSLALDAAFTIDKSRRKSGATSVLTYTSLVDAISEGELLSVRRLVTRLLSHLHEDKPFVCFVTGEKVPAEVLQGLSVQFSVKANCDNLETNGQVALVEVNAEDVECSVQGFGYFDSLRWVALAAWNRDLLGLVSSLRLSDLVPTTDEGLFFQRPKFVALRAALEHGRFLFEEINNGTRLRVASCLMSKGELAKRINRLISE